MTTTIDPRRVRDATLGAGGYGLFINNEWRPAASGAVFSVTNPATGDHLTDIADGAAADVRAAIDAAAAALPKWGATPAQVRARMLRKAADLMMDNVERLATIMTLEQGKPLEEAKGEIAYAASFLTWFAGEGERAYGQIIPAPSSRKRLFVFRQPVGVCALITPWNFPSAMLTRKLGPALAAGCVAVCKPAEQTPLSALELAKLFVAAGFPPGVVNIVTTSDPAGFADIVFGDDRVRKVSFTGSTEVGKSLIARAAPGVKRLSLELGGNAPFIVFDDADLAAAVTGAMQTKFRNMGQTCISANRVFVQRGIYDRFVEAFAAQVRKLVVGNGLDPATTVGPLIDTVAQEKVERHVADARSGGAQIVTGGHPATVEGGNGAFWAPTVLRDVSTAMLVAREETFGPVAPIIPFDTEDEVIRQANDSPFGLAAYFYTRDISRVLRVAEALEYGIVGANDANPSLAQTPFGGFKQSGLGREGGAFGIDEFLEVKYVSLGI